MLSIRHAAAMLRRRQAPVDTITSPAVLVPGRRRLSARGTHPTPARTTGLSAYAHRKAPGCRRAPAAHRRRRTPAASREIDTRAHNTDGDRPDEEMPEANSAINTRSEMFGFASGRPCSSSSACAATPTAKQEKLTKVHSQAMAVQARRHRGPRSLHSSGAKPCTGDAATSADRANGLAAARKRPGAQGRLGVAIGALPFQPRPTRIALDRARPWGHCFAPSRLLRGRLQACFVPHIRRRHPEAHTAHEYARPRSPPAPTAPRCALDRIALVEGSECSRSGSVQCVPTRAETAQPSTGSPTRV